LLWRRGASSSAGTGIASRLATWDDGSVVIGGAYEGTLTFALGEPGQIRLASTGEEIFLARYDADGGLVWARRAITAPYMPDWHLAAGADGGIVLYGTLENVTTFSPGLSDETRLEGGNIGFVVKLDGDGKVLWARALAQPSGTNRIASLATFPDGSVAFTGSFLRILTLGAGSWVARARSAQLRVQRPR
jgi:hypothetical protein